VVRGCQPVQCRLDLLLALSAVPADDGRDHGAAGQPDRHLSEAAGGAGKVAPG